ncbi:MAG: hypothetical protein NTU61_04150 [Candidatus Altiarchaeota archaeon]|nr:hypothetical protein [Candidatus Altiarchaeota archaeon]
MKKHVVFFILFLFLLWVCGCLGGSNDSSAAEEATAACILKCQSVKVSEDLDIGPCLSDDIKEDWVCDVAHIPRHLEDNEAKNQCIAFNEGKAHHFVELNDKCEVLRVQ